MSSRWDSVNVLAECYLKYRPAGTCYYVFSKTTVAYPPLEWRLGHWRSASIIQKQQLFWIGNHFDADIRQNFADTLSKAIEQGYTKEMLADTLKEQFGDIADKSSHYWQGLAEHTALRIREFGRLQGYKKVKAKYYKLVVILDDRTSDICRALAAQDKIYPLNDTCRGEWRFAFYRFNGYQVQQLGWCTGIHQSTRTLDQRRSDRIRFRDEPCRSLRSAYWLSTISLEVQDGNRSNLLGQSYSASHWCKF